MSLAILAATAVALRGRISEEYYLWKLETGDPDEQVAAAERLGDTRSVRAVPGIVGLFRKEVASHLASGRGSVFIITTGNPDSHIGERGRRLKKALVAIGKPATLDLLRVMHLDTDHYTCDVLLAIYSDWWSDLRASAGPQVSTYNLLLRRLESDPAQPEEVRKAAAVAFLREARRR